ncbi:hypothetical protein AYO20_04135 [Fonsecaea nubica]|uniref:Uncharacterized protein n=1 Tax=Fonsecaea nubica TaxID=856822 RepID=A0A178D376_9EURO|nr:hypothetical protein AYO20_04135 [Fonsecaea nubica]OAL36519.1 hypothetical protein AYO20_04135 [Fonsecaea nubica]
MPVSSRDGKDVAEAAVSAPVLVADAINFCRASSNNSSAEVLTAVARPATVVRAISVRKPPISDGPVPLFACPGMLPMLPEKFAVYSLGVNQAASVSCEDNSPPPEC